MAEADVAALTSAILSKCMYSRNSADRIRQEFAAVRSVFRTLLPKEQSLGNSNTVIDTKLMDVIALDGVLQVGYSGRTYNVPVRVCLLHGFPNEAPRVSVVPTAAMRLAPQHPFMSEDGIVRIPVMNRWNSGISLVTLLTDLIEVFSHAMPVFTKSSTVRSSSTEVNKSSAARPSSAEINKRGVAKESRPGTALFGHIPAKSAEIQPPNNQRRIVELEKEKSDLEATARMLAGTTSQLKAAIVSDI